jgi:hypothetical protein
MSTIIKGKVVNGYGTPQIGTLVQAQKISGPGDFGQATAGADGVFNISLTGVTSSTTYKVFPPPEGFATPSSVDTTIEPDATVDVGTFVTP